MVTQVHDPGGREMVRRELWEAIRRVADEEGLSIRALARRFELDCKTGVSCQVVVKQVGEIPRSQGKAVRVVDHRKDKK